LFSVAMNSAPTAPVTPAMATTGSLRTLVSTSFEHDLRANASAFVARENRFPLFRIMLEAIKKPRTFWGRGFGSDDAIVRLRAHASRAPEGLGFGRGFGGRKDHGTGLMGKDRRIVNRFCPKIR
jgi:hypothetical protein